MGFFRRGPHGRDVIEVTVGVGNQRLRIRGVERGITTLDELRTYVSAVTGRDAVPIEGGRDPVAVLSAKMDLAELVNDTAGAALLALEDLVERQIVSQEDVPAPPELPPLGERLTNYEYIQATHRRSEARLAWLAEVDALLSAHDAALLPPTPEKDPTRMTRIGGRER
jgi:hypothetical protein